MSSRVLTEKQKSATSIASKDSPNALDVIQNIPSLKNILRKGGIEFFNSGHAKGLLYLSRFVSKVHHKALSLRAVESESNVEQSEEEVIILKKETSHHQITEEGRLMRRRYAMSLASLALKSTKRFEIIENGGIGVLTEFSVTPDDDIISMSCAATFVFLSKEPSLRPQLVDERCLRALMFLIENPHIEIRKDCCRALCNLCLVEGFEKRVAKEGVAGLLVPIVKKAHDITEVCLKLLLNMSCVTEKFPRLEEATSALIELYHLHHRSEEKELLVMQALGNLSSLRGYHYHLVEEGMLAVIEKAGASTVKRCQVIASECLKNLSTCPRTRYIRR